MFLGSEHACFEVQQQYFDRKMSFYLFIKKSFYGNMARVPRALQAIFVYITLLDSLIVTQRKFVKFLSFLVRSQLHFL
jgi:hypothetical protein